MEQIIEGLIIIIRNKAKKKDCEELKKREENYKEYTPEEKTILRAEVEAAMSKMRNNKTSGSDHIVADMLKT